ncbi:MAG: SGNH/GDSL hydrolase family protein [Myxococcota bacterium]
MAKVQLETRQIGGIIIILFGVGMLLSALFTNPWVGRLTRGAAVVDYADVLRGYFLWALFLGAATFALGRKVYRGKSWADGFSVFFLLCALFVLGDRWLLTKLGLTIWEYDPELHYVHRPGAVRTLTSAGRPEDLIRINEHGFHDDEFPRQKPSGELRGLMLGDSVTMGYGVTYAETFSKKLEDLLAERDGLHGRHQIINAGVHGYSTFQERVTLERSLDLAPDFVTVGFCMNDVTEPFVVNTEYGGTGLDYHGVTQTPNPISGLLANETGFGRLLQKIAQAGKSLDAAKRLEIFNTHKMALESRTNPEFQEGWTIVLAEMGKLYEVAKANELPIALLIFPYTYQLGDPATRIPQQILTEHAAEHGVDVIDFTPIFAEAVYQEADVVALLEQQGKDPEQIAKFFAWRMDEYFFDEDHFREPGHALVAARLLEWLEAKGLAGAG